MSEQADLYSVTYGLTYCIAYIPIAQNFSNCALSVSLFLEYWVATFFNICIHLSYRKGNFQVFGHIARNCIPLIPLG